MRSVRNAIAILRCVSRSPRPLGISEIARRTGLDKSSVSRLVATLGDERLIERIPDSLSVTLGFGLAALSAPLLSDARLPALMRSRLEQLAQRLGETVNLSVWDGRESVSIVQALGTNAITHYAAPGQRNPAHATASGKVLLAHAPEADVEAILAGPLARFTERTVTDPDALRAQLREIRATGHALNIGEFASDVGAAAAIVRNAGGTTACAVTVTVPMYRFDGARQREIADALASAAADLSGGPDP